MKELVLKFLNRTVLGEASISLVDLAAVLYALFSYLL